MAGAFYEIMASESNSFYKQWPQQKSFCAERWGLFIEQARATLAHMLTLPIDEGQKEMIHEALVLDGNLHRNRADNTKRLFLDV